MQSLFNPKKRSSIALASAACMVAFTGGASANSVTLSQSPGLCGACGPNTYAVSSTFTVTVFANLGPDGGGQISVSPSLIYDVPSVTPLDCAETPAGQIVSGGAWAPFTVDCGPGGDGGLALLGYVLNIEQELFLGTPGTTGTLTLGTVTFHANLPGTSIVQSILAPFGGFVGADFQQRNPGIPLGSVTVTIVPEPTTLALLGLGLLGLGLSGRRPRRR